MANSTASLLETFPYTISNITKPTTHLTAVTSTEISGTVIVNIVLYMVLSIIITADNVLVICAVHFNTHLRRPTNFLILSLCVADLMVGVVVLPLRIVELLASEWTRSSYWCLTALNLSVFSITASVFNLLGVTLERYIAICHPMKYKLQVTSNRIQALIFLIWSSAFFISFLPLMGPGRKRESFQFSQGRALCRFADVFHLNYLLWLFVLVCGFPVLLFTAAYARIFYVARRHEKDISALQVGPSRSQQNAFRRAFNKESKATTTIAIVVGIFYICWSPLIVILVFVIVKPNVVTYIIILVAALFLYANSAINPLVYGCLNKEFRSTYKRLVGGLTIKIKAQNAPQERRQPPYISPASINIDQPSPFRSLQALNTSAGATLDAPGGDLLTVPSVRAQILTAIHEVHDNPCPSFAMDSVS